MLGTFFIRWNRGAAGMRHPRDMGAQEVVAFFTMLAVERRVPASMHNQALSALLFLYLHAGCGRDDQPARRHGFRRMTDRFAANGRMSLLGRLQADTNDR